MTPQDRHLKTVQPEVKDKPKNEQQQKKVLLPVTGNIE